MGKSCGEVVFPQGLKAHKPRGSRTNLSDSPPTIHMWISRGSLEGTDHLIRTLRPRP